MNVSIIDDPLAQVGNSPDPVRALRDAGLANQQVLIDRKCTLTILPSGRK